MPSITVSTETKTDLAALKLADSSRNSYGEVVAYLVKFHKDKTAPPPVPTVLPYYVALVVPKDRYVNNSIVSPCGTYGLSTGIQHIAKFGTAMNEWLVTQAAPFRFNFKPLFIPSSKTLVELQTSPEGVHSSDEFGLGVNGATLLMSAPSDEPTQELAAAIVGGKYRVLYIVVGGGRVDAGATSPTGDWGFAYGGDEDFSSTITRQLYPGMPDRIEPFCRAKSHELLHSVGAYCHGGDWFDLGEFSVPVHEQIDPGFSSFPLQSFVATDAAAAHHLAMETKLYNGQVLQIQKYSRPWCSS